MTIIASCGHQLGDDEGPDGMGWPLATRSFTRECTPAVSFGVYCTVCRDAALKEPDYVFRDDEAQMVWLNSDEAGSSSAE